MANELDPLSNVVAIIDYCRTAGTSPDLDVLAELLAKVPTSHPNPDKCCPDCVREKQLAIAAMNEAIAAAKPKSPPAAIDPTTGDGSRRYPYRKHVNGMYRSGKWCLCGQCGTEQVCRPDFDFYTGPRFPDGTLFCERCLTQDPARSEWKCPHGCPHPESDHTERGCEADVPNETELCPCMWAPTRAVEPLRNGPIGPVGAALAQQTQPTPPAETKCGVSGGYEPPPANGEVICKLPAGHDGRHDDGCVTWDEPAPTAEGGKLAEAISAFDEFGFIAAAHEEARSAVLWVTQAATAALATLRPSGTVAMRSGSEGGALDELERQAQRALAVLESDTERPATGVDGRFVIGPRVRDMQARVLSLLCAAAAEHAAEVERLKQDVQREIDLRAIDAEQCNAAEAKWADEKQALLRDHDEARVRMTAAERVAAQQSKDRDHWLAQRDAALRDLDEARAEIAAMNKALDAAPCKAILPNTGRDPWITVEDIASGSSFSSTQSNVKDSLVISLRSDVMRVRASLDELRQIDDLLARRPALDKQTRYENIVHAITTAGVATDKANRYLSDIKAILSLLGVDVAEANWTAPSVYATAQKAWHEVTNATVLARGERDAAQSKLLAVSEAWTKLRANMTVSARGMRGVWFRGGDAVEQVLDVEEALG